MQKSSKLASRSVLRVSGVDAQSFLQNIFTNDIRRVAAGVLQYNLLLTPQGKVLHDVFIFMRDDAYFIDIETCRRDDLLKRLAIFKLRAKVDIEKTFLCVFSYSEGFSDPRHKKLGHRFYGEDKEAGEEGAYDDFLISLGIPNGSKTIHYEKDFAHELNLDVLNAIAWDKGCFIGQEVVARVYNRGLAKKRLLILKGRNLKPDGDIRQVNSTADIALAVLRLDDAREGLERPEYLPP